MESFRTIVEKQLTRRGTSAIRAALGAGLTRDAIRSVLRGRTPSVDPRRRNLRGARPRVLHRPAPVRNSPGGVRVTGGGQSRSHTRPQTSGTVRADSRPLAGAGKRLRADGFHAAAVRARTAASRCRGQASGQPVSLPQARAPRRFRRGAGARVGGRGERHRGDAVAGLAARARRAPGPSGLRRTPPPGRPAVARRDLPGVPARRGVAGCAYPYPGRRRRAAEGRSA